MNLNSTMTRDEIELTPAGPTLDWHIAHFVMGLPNKELTSADCPCAYCGSQMRYCGARSWCSDCHEWRYTAYKDYSSDLLSAWEVIEKMIKKHFRYECRGGWHDDNNQVAMFDSAYWADENPLYKAYADNLPLAICRAALLAVMEFDK